ncbi:hypothetical protein PFISCL1PPCAC_5556, partial [Pristionchus fissidentatus]
LPLCKHFGNFDRLFDDFRFTRDSICHLNIRKKARRVEKKILKEEHNLQLENSEDQANFTQIARKIFEDLVYLDRDELKLRDFFKRIWRNRVMAEIIMAFFQSFSAGIHEYEFNRYWEERFSDAYWVGVDRVCSSFVLHYQVFKKLKFHRLKALAYMFAVALLVAAIRHNIIRFDKGNGCSDVELISGTSTIKGTARICEHFSETAPSALRLTSLVVVYLPMHTISLIYSYHLIIIIVTLARAKSTLPFSLYLFDLIP